MIPEKAFAAYIGKRTEMTMKTAARPSGAWRTIEIILLTGAAVFLLVGTMSLRTQTELADKVVRLHVLANSDSEEDQALKLRVRDAVLARATEILEQSADRKEAEARLRGQLLELERIAAEEISAAGYDYSVTAQLADTAFPTKEYDGFTLPAGDYLALRIVIGKGEGQNWWCVLFPPLCLIDPDGSELDGIETDQIAGGQQAITLKFKTKELYDAWH